MPAKPSCSYCGKPANHTRGDYPFPESGIANITLHDIPLIRCRHCGTVDPLIPRMDDEMRLLVLAIADKPCRLQGSDVRYLRNYLDMTQEDFARQLGVDKTTLSKWETGDDTIGEQSDRLIRVVALSLAKGLEDKIEAVVSHFPNIKGHKPRLRIAMAPKTMTYEYA